MRNTLYSCILITLLIMPTVYMQRQYMGNYLQNTADEAFLRLGDIEQRLASILTQPVKQPTVLHFTDPSCPCNWLAQSHIQSIHTDINDRFKIVTVTPESRPDISIPASPAVAILNQDGSLSYFGVYGFGAFCSQDAQGVLDKVLLSMKNNTNTHAIINTLGEGCYCRWPNQPEP